MECSQSPKTWLYHVYASSDKSSGSCGSRCLTDLVRCCILLSSLEQYLNFLELIWCKAVVGEVKDDLQGLSTQPEIMEEGASVKIFKLVKVKDRITVDPDDGYRDICLNVEVESTPTSSLLCALWYSVDCIVDSMMGIRTDSQTQSLAHWKWRLIWLFLQVAWTILSESSDQLEFVPVLNEYGVSMWNNRSQIRTHVCEVLRCFLILFACSYDGTHELTPLQHVYSRRLTPRAQSESELCLWHPLYPWKCRFSWYWTACTNWRQRDVMSILWKPETSLLNSKGTPHSRENELARPLDQ